MSCSLISNRKRNLLYLCNLRELIIFSQITQIKQIFVDEIDEDGMFYNVLKSLSI